MQRHQDHGLRVQLAAELNRLATWMREHGVDVATTQFKQIASGPRLFVRADKTYTAKTCTNLCGNPFCISEQDLGFESPDECYVAERLPELWRNARQEAKHKAREKKRTQHRKAKAMRLLTRCAGALAIFALATMAFGQVHSGPTVTTISPTPSTSTVTWTVGPQHTSGAANYGPPDDAKYWAFFADDIGNWAAGTYIVDTAEVVTTRTGPRDGQFDELWFIVAKHVGGVWTTVVKYEMTDDFTPADAVILVQSDLTGADEADRTFTIAGTETDYVMGVAITREDVEGDPTNHYPACGLCNGANDALTYRAYGTSAWDPDTSLESDASPSGAWTSASAIMSKVEVRTTNHTLISEGTVGSKLFTGTAAYRMLPYHTSDYAVILRGVTFGAANTLDLAFQDYSAAGALETEFSVQLDGPNDEIAFPADGGTDVALSSEEADTFDLLVNVRPGAGTVDVLYLNRTTGQGGDDDDTVTLCHSVQAAGSPASKDEPHGLYISGASCAIATMELAYLPMVIIGDSNSSASYYYSDSPGDLNDINADYLGAALPTAFSRSHWKGWRASREGGATYTSGDTTLTSALDTWDGTTGDLGQVTGACVVVALGTNDINHNVSTSAHQNRRAAQALYSVATIVHDAVANSNEVIIVGCPYINTTPGTATTAKRAAAAQYHRALEGLAQSVRCTYYNPWDLIRLNTGTYMADTLHYTAAGATAVATKVYGVYSVGLWSDYRSAVGEHGVHAGGGG